MSTGEAEKIAAADLPKEGEILAGKYQIDRVLGHGGMGVVVAAHHTALRQKVAVKFLLRDAAKSVDACERFLREARAAVSIQSEHVARVTDVGTLDSGAPYMVMEFLTGADLSQVLEQRGPLPVEQAVDYVLQACEAIAEAHSIGLIHRDLKPANLFLTTRADGSSLVKVLDFGLSKATKSDPMNASLTAAHVLMGSPYYMAPEQIRSFKSIDARADIWAIGVILYQLLTGSCPFDAESLGALFMAIGSDPVASIRERRPDVPEGLEAAINKCLVKDVKGRTQTIAELARSLAPFGTETSYISVERIARVLSDNTPFSRAPSQRGGEAGAPAAANGAAKPAAPFATTEAAGAAGAATVPAPSPNAGRSDASVSARSAAMSAMSVSEPGAALARPAAKGRGGLVLGLGGVAAVGVAAAAFFALRSPAGGAAAQGVAPPVVDTARATATAPAPVVSVSSAPVVAASGAPAVTPAPEASSAAPVASASATTAPSVRAPAGKATAAAPKASAGPKLSKPVSAALKHDEKFD